MVDEGRSRHVTLSVADGDESAAVSAPADGVPRLWIRPGVRDPLVVLSNFLSLSPPSPDDQALVGRWLDTFLGLVDACRGRCDAACPTDGEAVDVVCRVPWDDRDAVDWVALAVDQACGCVVSEGDEGPLTLVRAVDKRLMRDGEMAALPPSGGDQRGGEDPSGEDQRGGRSPVETLSPDADKVVIISYADPDHEREALEEVLAILRGLPEGFLETGQQVVCNKGGQFMEDGLLERVVAGEPLESSPVRSTQRARLEAARVVWLHNALKEDVCDTLACLPPDSGLMLHLLGHGTRQGLQTHERAPGQGCRRSVLRARDLKMDPRWRRRRIKLLYLSLSCARERGGSLLGPRGASHARNVQGTSLSPGGSLLGHPRSLPRQLLRDSPRIAATVCFRWALPRATIKAISEAFYEAYWGGPSASRSLFEARKEAYARWRGDGDGLERRYYCAWAAPMVITQGAADPDPSPSAEA